LWNVPLGVWFALSDPGDPLTVKGPVEWRFLIQPILLLIGVPSAFVLWAFRDHNAKSALENQRKDINLKEFQEIQLRAAGGLDEKLPAKARQTLQVAAIYQLRPFLRGEYGSSFRRPAWELLKALLATSAHDCGYVAITDWVRGGGFPEVEGEAERAQRHVEEIRSKIEAIDPDAVAIAARTLIKEDGQRLFRHDLPLGGGRYDRVDLADVLLTGIRLDEASFVGAILCRAHLEGADLRWAHLECANLDLAYLEGAILSMACLEGASLFGTHLEGANLSGAGLKVAELSFAHLEGANLFMAHLESASLNNSYLEGANLSRAYLDDNTNLLDATYDDTTRFTYPWDTLTEAEREAARQPWRDRGMIHVDEKEGH
jgi:uncharacterized protein YjbI with pentapeptide repeats